MLGGCIGRGLKRYPEFSGLDINIKVSMASCSINVFSDGVRPPYSPLGVEVGPFACVDGSEGVSGPKAVPLSGLLNPFS